jgi:hypothetical protein
MRYFAHWLVTVAGVVAMAYMNHDGMALGILFIGFLTLPDEFLTLPDENTK